MSEEKIIVIETEETITATEEEMIAAIKHIKHERAEAARKAKIDELAEIIENALEEIYNLGGSVKPGQCGRYVYASETVLPRKTSLHSSLDYKYSDRF